MRRGKVKARSRQTCYYCGCGFTTEPWLGSQYRVTDHVEPLSRGGEDTPENVITCCAGCNTSKRNSFLLEWVFSGRYFWRGNRYTKEYGRFYTSGKWRWFHDADDIAEIKRRANPIPRESKRRKAA